MTFMMSKPEVLKLYKTLLRESSKISAYNFREYALRRIRDGFKQNKAVAEKLDAQALVQEAQKDLELIKRQAIIGQLYSADKLVIEHHLRRK